MTIVVAVTPQPTIVVNVGESSANAVQFAKRISDDFTAGEAFAFGEVGYAHTDGKIYLAQSGGTAAEAEASLICVAPGGVIMNAVGSFASYAILTASGTAGSLAFLSGTAGAITTSAPSTGYSKILGRFITATKLVFSPDINTYPLG